MYITVGPITKEQLLKEKRFITKNQGKIVETLKLGSKYYVTYQEYKSFGLFGA